MALMLSMTIQHIPCTIGSQRYQALYVLRCLQCRKENYIQEVREETCNLEQYHTQMESLKLLYLRTELEYATRWGSFPDKQWQLLM